MFKRPPRILRERGVVVSGAVNIGPRSCTCVKEAGDDIKAQSSPCSRAGLVPEPGDRASPQPRLLARIDCLRSTAMAAESFGPGRSSRLHFHDHQAVAALRDQIDLDPRGPDVARDDLIPSRFEITSGARLSFFSESLSIVGHRASRFPAHSRMKRSLTWLGARGAKRSTDERALGAGLWRGSLGYGWARSISSRHRSVTSKT